MLCNRLGRRGEIPERRINPEIRKWMVLECGVEIARRYSFADISISRLAFELGWSESTVKRCYKNRLILMTAVCEHALKHHPKLAERAKRYL